MRLKLILLACVSVAFASCKKDNMESAMPQSPAISMDQQVADLIRKADKNLYDKIYNQSKSTDQRTGTIDVKIIHGIFISLQGDIASGTCFPHATNPCMVIVTAGTPGGSSGNDLNADLQFPEADPAQLVINISEPVVKQITELTTTNNLNGSINVTYK